MVYFEVTGAPAHVSIQVDGSAELVNGRLGTVFHSDFAPRMMSELPVNLEVELPVGSYQFFFESNAYAEPERPETSAHSTASVSATIDFSSPEGP